MAHVAGFLSPTFETWIEFPTLAKPQQFQVFGGTEWADKEYFILFLFILQSLHLSNNKEKF